MSFGQNSFDQNPYGSNPYGNNPSGSNPYGQSPYQSPGAPGPDPYGPKPASRFWMYAFFGLIGGGIALCGCCGIGGFVGFGALGGILSNHVSESLAGNPVIEEHIGTITKCEWNFSDSIEHADDDIQVFDVEGTKGKGQIFGVLSEGEDEALTSGTLHTEQGNFNLFP